ncbi:MAG TPA: malonate decarboxylase holo-[acyl-carrier-protein] synthase [Albitalea sp.]|nr:malonate decarboxylase holo-[acyl-carrier-protein] synthase [Albitalea sp.]
MVKELLKKPTRKNVPSPFMGTGQTGGVSHKKIGPSHPHPSPPPSSGRGCNQEFPDIACALEAAVAPLTLRRHDLVWLHAEIWERSLLTDLDAAQRDITRNWFRAGRPAVLRRRHPQEPEHGIVLGVPLSPGRGRLRLALVVSESAIRDVQRPPALSEILQSAPPHWRAPLQRLAVAQGGEWSLRVYGSLLWQHLTGETYLRADSDVDLLLEVNSAAAWHKAVTRLHQWQLDTGLRADGEVLLRDGRAVAWRELVQSPARVLVKSATAVELLPYNTVIGLLAPP